MRTAARSPLRWWPLALVAILAITRPAGAQGDKVPEKRVAALARGVNLSHLTWTAPGTAQDGPTRTLSPVDVAVIRGIGMTHVRLAFPPSEIWDQNGHRFQGEGLRRLKQAVDLLLSGGVAVVLDAHAGLEMGWAMPDPTTKRAEELERFWSALALEFAGTDPQRVFLEILNEPHGTTDNGELWGAAQERLVTAIRASAPHHTIVATGDDWGSIDGLKRLKPLADKNVVYSFHLYEPHTFTHQGTSWGTPQWKLIRGLDYPAKRENAALVAARIGAADETARKAADEVRQYGKDAWDGAKVREKVKEAAAWGKEHGVPVYCGEFGAFRPFAPTGSRVAWIQDARRAFDDLNVGWAMWEYRGTFGLLEEDAGSHRTDEGVLRALGLRK